ncbi:MAG TPA: iron-containing alcohol dehydrogenase, partial [Polyangia bacterium]|nr:iron-containing alcohol dehydrogenase [Polyangia bacterium]
MNFAFRTATQVVFGRGEGSKVAAAVAPLGRRVFLVTGRSSLERAGALGTLAESLQKLGLDCERWGVAGEPDTPLADEGARRVRESRCDVVLAVGGGSVLDAGKAVAALATNPGAALDYIEEVGGGQPLARPPLPLVAVPTTAGSGSEVTRNTVLRIPELQVKRSIRSDLLLPRVAIVDPALSATAPRSVAAAAGLDALTHLVEAYVSTGAQPTTDALILPGIRHALRGLRALAT